MLAEKRSRANIISGKYINPTKEVAQKSAIKIQRYWRFYRKMRRDRVQKQKYNILIGMLIGIIINYKNKKRHTHIVKPIYSMLCSESKILIYYYIFHE